MNVEREEFEDKTVFRGSRFEAIFGKADHPWPDNAIILNQTHSAKSIYQQNEAVSAVEADAQFTDNSQFCLGIRTADCVPVLGFHPKGWALAIHAGWRGIAGQIIENTLKAINSSCREALSPQDWLIFIGPHIREYEVETPLAEKIIADSVASTFPELEKTRPGYCLVPLEELVRQQLREWNCPESQIFSITHNTLTDAQYHSHRRSGEKAGRQLSYIQLREG